MIRIRQIKIPITSQKEEILKNKIIQILKIKEEELEDWTITKEAIDARDKITYVYEVDVKVGKEKAILNKISNPNVLKAPSEKLVIPQKTNLNKKIIIVGTGPAGLFCGYVLALEGYKPLIIDRGKKIEDRIKDVQNFWENNLLNPESNVQFGEGGAGTFSDGKLNTLIKDKDHMGKFVLETFVKFGAPKEILYIKNPHIGTDILRNVIINMRNYLLSLGVEIRYNTKLTNIIIENNQFKEIEVNNKELITGDNLVLALGNSARDTFKMLYQKGLLIMAKPFAVGIRVMHDQEMINKNQYKEYASLLPTASYKLTFTTKEGRGVYSFCMCPGGYVINASSEKEKLVINGMSNHSRDSKTANSAIVVTVTPKDYGNDPLDGMEFQNNLEAKTYQIGKGNIPLQKWIDFKNNVPSKEIGTIKPNLKGNYTLSNLRAIYPDYIINSLMEGMANFGKKIKGFDQDDTLICAVESRTSSPIRIDRDENMESNIKGIYPIGEGSGYAGGITSSAIDGIKLALKL